ncbi:unnamed protein product, partial [Heterobilharzia americana]
MSSTASVVPNVSYHLPKPVTQNFQHFDCNSSGSGLEFNHQSSSNGDYASKTSFMKAESSICASKLVSYNIDAALRLSLKSSSVPSNDHLPTSTEKLSQRPIFFHESSAPPLDAIIKQKIQNLPGSLILTDSKESKPVEKNFPETKLLCSDEELDHLCRSGAQCIPKRALGFGNSGNTCYLNSVLQCILATGPLLAYVNCKHANSSNCVITNGRSNLPNLNKSRFCVLCGLARLINEHRSQTGHTVPSYFVTNVRAVCPSLRPYQQEDAHEFLLGLLSRMEDSAMAGLGKVPRKMSETNVIRRIFGGVMRSEVTCHSCHKVSARDEQWFNLSMDITCARSLQQCLYNYIRSEELSGQNAYKCENCRQLRPAMRKCTVYRAPPILIIQFNRFSRHQKLDMHVEFPSSFNLRPFMTQSKGSPILYKLYATVNHEGFSCRSGHYVSFTHRHGQWLSHNDSFISTINSDHVFRQYPYLLFYEAIRSSANSTVNTSIMSKSPSSVNQVLKPSPLNSSTMSTTSQSSSFIDTTVQQQPNRKEISNSLSTSLPIQSNLFKSFSVTKQASLPTIESVTASTTLFSQTQTTNSLSYNGVNTTSSMPKIVFNPKVSSNKLNILSSSTIPFKSTSDNQITAESFTSNTKTTQNVDSSITNKSIVSTIPSTTTTVPPIALSASIVRELLYGKENPPNLWTERPTPLGKTSVSASSLPENTKICVEGQSSDNLLSNLESRTITNVKAQVMSPQLSSITPRDSYNGERKPIDPLVDYLYEESDSNTEMSPPPSKRCRVSNNDYNSSVTWVPLNSHNGNDNDKSEKNEILNPSSHDHQHSKKHKRCKKKHKSHFFSSASSLLSM